MTDNRLGRKIQTDQFDDIVLDPLNKIIEKY